VIPLRDQEFLRARFARELTGAVRIDYFTQRRLPVFIPGREECAYCEEAQTLLKEIAALSEKITLTVHEFTDAAKEAARLGVDRVPGIVVRGALNRPLRFFGFPVGNQLVSLIEGIVDASRGKVELTTETVRHLRRLLQTVRLDLFVTPACPHCPDMTRLAYKLALETTRVRVDVVEISEFPRLAQRYGIRAVPTVVLDERAVLVGAMDETAIVSHITQAAQGRALRPAGGPPGPSTPLEQPHQEGTARTGSGIILP
jgi:glutaredoxin-like protein